MRYLIIILIFNFSSKLDSQVNDPNIKSDNENIKYKRLNRDSLIKDINRVFFLKFYKSNFDISRTYFIEFEYDKDPVKIKENEESIEKFDIITRAIRIDSSECYYCDKFNVLIKLYFTINKNDSILGLPYDSVKVDKALRELQEIQQLPELESKLNKQLEELVLHLYNYRQFIEDSRISLSELKKRDRTRLKDIKIETFKNYFFLQYPTSLLKEMFYKKQIKIENYRYLYSLLLNFKENQDNFNINIIK